MYLRDMWASCIRRWYVVVLCLAVSVGVVVLAAAFVVKPTWKSTATIVLVPPPNPDQPKLNRYLALGGLSESVDILTRSMSSDQTAKQLAKQAPSASYEVAPDFSSSAPIAIITATSHDREQAQAMLQAVLARVPVNLRSLQRDLEIKPASQITNEVVTEDARPKISQKTRLRLLGALSVALVLGSAVVVATADGLLLRRSKRAAEPVTEPAEPVPAPEPDDGLGNGRQANRPAPTTNRATRNGVARKPSTARAKSARRS